jgi:hypothetical protein
MVSAQQLVDKFLEKAQIHKPNMTAHQLQAYIIGLLADELAWAFNNDDTVATNVRQLLHKLDPRKLPQVTPIAATQNSSNQPIQKVTSVKSKLGSDISITLSHQCVDLFLQQFPKAVVKDLRDKKNGFFWIFVPANAYNDDSQLFQWLKKNKFEYSESEKAWYYPII